MDNKDTLLSRRILWESDDTYSNYRIPGLCVSSQGTLLAYCEARRTSGDWAHMDILLFRSTDGGSSFSAPLVMASGTPACPTVNNPVCIAEPDGRLHFLYCKNYAVEGGGVFHRISEDDGLSWSDPIGITDSTRPDIRNVFATGPGHGICTPSGRLLVPVWLVLKESGAPIREHAPSVVSTLYSDDHGATWALGELLPATPTVPSPSEAQAVCLPDGSVYLNVRTAGVGCRASAWSPDGASGWTPLACDRALIDPTCFGSAVALPDGSVLCVHCADTADRTRLIVQRSYDGGRSWAQSYLIEPGGAGYADIAALPDGTVVVLYERAWGSSDVLVSFHLQD